MRLPSLKLTQRSTCGAVRHRTVPRGVVGSMDSEECSSGSNDSAPGSDVDEVNDYDNDHDLNTMLADSDHQELNEPSLHYIKQKAAVAAWEQNRLSMLKACIECNAMPNDQTYFCSNCFADAHRTVNIFHVGEMWEVSHGSNFQNPDVGLHNGAYLK